MTMAKVCEKCGNEYDEALEVCPTCSDVSSEAVTEEILVEDMEKELAEKLGMDEVQTDESENVEAGELSLEDALAAAKQAGELKKNKEVVEENEADDEDDEEVVPKSKLPLILGITFVVLLLVAAGAVALIYMQTGAGAPYNKVVQQYLQGYQEKDASKLFDCYPKEAQDMMLENATAEEMWSSIDQAFSTSLGDDWSANYTIGTSKEISADDLKKLKSDTENMYSASWNWGEKGYWVYADLELSGSQNEVTMPLVFGVVKLDGKWYVIYETVAQGQGTADDASQSSNGAAAQE